MPKSPEVHVRVRLDDCENDELLQRALRAYYRGDPDGVLHMHPAGWASAAVERGGREYVVLRNGDGVLAFYRVTQQGGLRGVYPWPTWADTW